MGLVIDFLKCFNVYGRKRNFTLNSQRLMTTPIEIGFNKKRVSIILGVIAFCLIVFGISESLSFFVLLIASIPFVVIFWGTFGEKIMSFNWTWLRPDFNRSAIRKPSLNLLTKKDKDTRDYLNRI
tara:strand:- start:121 stop:495 length:375 start_codon:yes stop_codon:yes gene_type:complete